MQVLLIEAKLRLNSSAVDAIRMKTLPCAPSQFHVLFTTVGIDGERNLEVHASNELGIGKLPNVDMMTSDDTRQCLNVLSNVLDVDVLWSRLEEDAGGSAGQRNRGVENNGCDEERNGGVGIELAGPIRKPDDESRSHDTNVSESVTDDVQNHGIHSHITVVMAMAALFGSLSGQSVIVAVVNTRIASLASGSRMVMRRLFVGTERATSILNILKERRLLIGFVVIGGKGGFQIGIALTRRFNGGGHTSGNDLLTETGRMDAHIFETGQARVAALNGVSAIASPGMGREATGSGTGLLPVVVLFLEAQAAAFVGTMSMGMALSIEEALFFVVGVSVVVGMFVIVVIVVIVVVVIVGMSMGVSMAAENEEAEKVRKQTGGTDDEHHLGVVDFRGFDESSKSFENDGNAESDKEDGVEKSTKNLGANPTKRELVSGGLLRGGNGPETDD